MYNKKELKKTERSDAKPNPWAKDRVVKPGAPKVDPNGYWDPANIGRIIEVPSSNITMKGVEQPLIGVGSDTGMTQHMVPGADYTFPFDSSVVEYPVEQYMDLTDEEIETYRAGGYIVDETPYPSKHNPANSFSVTDPRSMQEGGNTKEDKEKATLNFYYNQPAYTTEGQVLDLEKMKTIEDLPYPTMKDNFIYYGNQKFGPDAYTIMDVPGGYPTYKLNETGKIITPVSDPATKAFNQQYAQGYKSKGLKSSDWILYHQKGSFPTSYSKRLNEWKQEDLEQQSNGGYVAAQITHFQSGGNTDPGNNALELHMFYDKDVFAKGGEIGYYTDQEIEDLRKQGYIVEEE